MADPLMPFSIFRIRTLAGSNTAGFLMGTMLFSMFLLLTLYMQQVLGYSPMETGVAYLACAGTAIIWANVAAALVTRVGIKPIMVSGMALMVVGIALFTQISPGGSYVADLLPGLLLIGIGMPFAFVAISIGALAGVPDQEAGLASGINNTAFQIGGALGVAALSAIAICAPRTWSVAGPRSPPPSPRASRQRCGPAWGSQFSGSSPRLPSSRTSVVRRPKGSLSSERRRPAGGTIGERPGGPLPVRPGGVPALRAFSPSTNPAPSRGPSRAARGRGAEREQLGAVGPGFEGAHRARRHTQCVQDSEPHGLVVELRRRLPRRST